MTWLPRARKKDLIVEKMEDETLVYDLRNDRAHCLNRTASSVWRSCDGKRNVRQIAQRVSAEFAEQISDDVVQLALGRLSKARLLQDNQSLPTRFQSTRRDVVKHLGKAAAIALPVITSILAPEAAQAASCVPPGQCPGPGGLNIGRCCCPAPQSNKKLCLFGGCTGTTC
jgi:hypothetical protein